MTLNENTKFLIKGNLINNQRYEIVEEIGVGGFGNVFLALDYFNDKKSCALKLVCSLMTEENRKQQEREIELLKKSENEFIVKYIDHFIYESRLCIVTQLFSDGDLDEYINQRKNENKKFSKLEILDMARQILNGLNHLHKIGIIHLDIKPKNIYRQNSLLVIGDLGLAKNMDEISKSSYKIVGTYCYICPEIFENKKCTNKSDIWSFGCVLYEMSELKKAFSGDALFTIIKSIMEMRLPETQEKYLNSMLQKCFNRNPSNRSTAEELIKLVNKHIEIGNNPDPNEINERKECGILLRKLEAHSERILSLVYLGNGLLASGSADKLIKIWNVNEGRMIKILEGHKDWINSMINLKNGMLASGSIDKTIKIWDIDKGELIKTIEHFTGCVFTMALLKDGYLASGGDDQKVRIWNYDQIKLKWVLEGHKGDILSLAYRENGYLASGSWDYTIKIWDYFEGVLLNTLEGHSSGVWTLRYMKNEHLASGSFDKTIKIWDVSEGVCLNTLEGHEAVIRGLAPLQNGYLASSSEYDKSIRVWDTSIERLIGVLPGHEDMSRVLASTENGLIVSGNLNGTLNIWGFSKES